MIDGYIVEGAFIETLFKNKELIPSKDNKEIERIWILPQMPPTELINHNIPHEISYLFSDKTGEMRVVKRLKPEGNKFSITVKSRGDLIRDEWEDDNLPKWTYDILVKKAICKIVKTRYFINYNNYILEVDKYSYREIYKPYFIMNMDIKNKVRLECEFVSEEEANKFVLPSWAEGAIEVTTKPEFKNSVIALNGWPNNLLKEKEKDMQVDIGQVWEDKDPRRVGRKFKVDRIVNGKAVCQVLQAGLSEGKSPVRIRLDRFIPKYYSLTANKSVSDLTPTPVQNERTFLEDVEKLTSFKWNSPIKNYVNANIGSISVLLHKVDDKCFDLKLSINNVLVSSKIVNNTLENVIFVELKNQIKSLLDDISDVCFDLQFVF